MAVGEGFRGSPLKPVWRPTDATGMTREERLLAVVRAQSEIAAAALDRRGLVTLVAEHACEISGARAAVVELSGAAQVDIGAPAAGPTISLPLISAGASVGTLTVYAGEGGSFEAEAAEMLGMMAAVVGAQLQAPGDGETPQRAGWRSFEERVSLECSRRAREGSGFSVVMLDIDGLKTINDIHGVQSGDGVLRTLSAVLDRWTRAIDGVYLVASGRFGLVLPGASVETAAMLTERITAQMADAHPLHVPLSFGIAGPGDDPAIVIRAADEALDQAKRERRQRAAA